MLTQAPKGTKDLLPQDSYRWQAIENLERKFAETAGFREVRTPIFEHTELFLRSVGDTTDIVQKEMYTFMDKGDRSITLRPEGTAGTARAFLEANLYAEALPCKMYYLSAPIFRYEAPQSGRFREHHQFGMECYGAKEASADAELIALLYKLMQKLGGTNLSFNINSIGCENCRPQYQEALKTYLKKHENDLCKDCKERLERNPLRILDCKNEACHQIVNDAPSMLEKLCDECNDHFIQLQSYLTATEIPFHINDRIVRGLDYYTKTVFELITSTEKGNLTVCGGGRYDKLVEAIGGHSIPAVGFGMGIERVLMLLDSQGVQLPKPNTIDVFVAYMGEECKIPAFKLVQAFRENSIKADSDHCGRSLKAQFKYANKIGASLVAIIGGDELSRGVVKMRNMVTKEEMEIAIEDVAIKAKELVK